MKTTILSTLGIIGFMFLSSEAIAQTTRTTTTTSGVNEMNASAQQMVSPKKMMKAIDQNDDKMISMGEAEASDYPMLAERFEDMDSSGDEMIDMKELKSFHKQMKQEAKDGMKDERMNMEEQIDSMNY